MNAEELKRVWSNYCEKNDFKLNPDEKHVNLIIKGLLKNEEKYGLKLCPCRLRDGTREKDLEMICPCNFKADTVWQEKGMCWCGLFVKK